MLKLYAFVLLLFIDCQQSVAQQKHYDALSTIQDASTKFTDSLIAIGVDTIFSYYFGYAACPSESAPIAFVYWSGKGTSQVVIFKESWLYKKKKRSVRMAIHYHECEEIPFSVNYFVHNYDKIAQDTLITSEPGKRTLYVFNHPFEYMEVRVGKLRMEYEVRSFDRSYNPQSYKIAFIDNFRSFILSYFYTNWKLKYVK
jgi:hypothetical protein